VFWLYLAAMIVSMTITGIVISVSRKLPEILGVFIGGVTATIFFTVFAAHSLRPPFGILLVLFMPPIGALGGAFTGLLLRLLARY